MHAVRWGELWQVLVGALVVAAFTQLSLWSIRALTGTRAHPIAVGALQGAGFGMAMLLGLVLARGLGQRDGVSYVGNLGVSELVIIIAVPTVAGAWLAGRRARDEEFRARIERAAVSARQGR